MGCNISSIVLFKSEVVLLLKIIHFIVTLFIFIVHEVMDFSHLPLVFPALVQNIVTQEAVLLIEFSSLFGVKTRH
jgi:hypothetical protein